MLASACLCTRARIQSVMIRFRFRIHDVFALYARDSYQRWTIAVSAVLPAPDRANAVGGTRWQWKCLFCAFGCGCERRAAASCLVAGRDVDASRSITLVVLFFYDEYCALLHGPVSVVRVRITMAWVGVVGRDAHGNAYCLMCYGHCHGWLTAWVSANFAHD